MTYLKVKGQEADYVKPKYICRNCKVKYIRTNEYKKDIKMIYSTQHVFLGYCDDCCAPTTPLFEYVEAKVI